MITKIHTVLRKMNTPSFLSTISIVVYFLFSFCVLVYVINKPAFNWDMIGYVASAKNFEIHDKEKLHEYVYVQLKEFVPSKVYKDLLTGPYREVMKNDSEAFSQQLPYYQIKIGYVFLIFLLDNVFYLNPFFSSYFISAISMCIGLWILFITFRKYIHPVFFGIFPFFAPFLDLTKIASMSTPDSLAFLIVTLIIYSFITESWIIFLLFPIAILARTDLLILVVLIQGYMCIKKGKWRLLSVISFLSCCGLFLAIHHWSGQYGWTVLFYFTFLQHFHYPKFAHIDFQIIDYLNVIKTGLNDLFASKEFQFYLCIFSLSWILKKPYTTKKYPASIDHKIFDLILITFYYSLLHFLLFPSSFPRFYLLSYMVGVFGFFSVLTKLISFKKRLKLG